MDTRIAHGVGLAFAAACWISAGITAAQPSFPPEIQVSPDVPGENFQDAVAAAGDTAVCVWSAIGTLGTGTDDDIAFVRTIDGGLTWSDAELLNDYGTADTGEDAYPFIGTDGDGVWIAAWRSEGQSGGQDPDFYFSRSVDDGETWSAAALLNIDALTDADRFDDYVRFATDGAGTWIAVWMSAEYIQGQTFEYDVSYIVSADNGATWSAPALLNMNAATDSYSDLFPSVATDGMGTWLVAWCSTEPFDGVYDNEQDVLVSRSDDNGATWTPPALLNTNAMTDSFNDQFRHIAADGLGNFVAVWVSADGVSEEVSADGDISVAQSSDGGVSWSAPMLLDNDGLFDPAYDFMPDIAGDADGNWLVVWASIDVPEQTVGSDSDLRIAASDDGGATWSSAEYITPRDIDETLADRWPRIASGGSSQWYLAWMNGESLFRGIEDYFNTEIFVTAVNDSSSGGGGSGGCFIVTAAYGSPLAPQLDDLRSVRDQFLLPSVIGAAFVDAYYRVSPPAAAWIAEHPLARLGVRVSLAALLGLEWALVTWIVAVLMLSVPVLRGARRKSRVRGQ